MSLTTMPPATTPIPEPAAPPSLAEPQYPSYFSHIYRLTVAQYDRIIEAAILGKEGERVELIEGILVAKMGRNRPHVQAGKKGLRALASNIPLGYHAVKEDPIVVSDYSKPEPDLAVVRGTIEDYDDRDVKASDVALVTEISDSTLRADQEEMRPIYAASRIPFYWIINLMDHQVEVYSDPEGREYRTSQVYTREREVPLILDGVVVGRIRVANLLP